MIIEIKQDIFETADFRRVSLLVQMGIHRDRYKVYVDISKVRTTDVYIRLDVDDRDVLTQTFNSAIISEIQPNAQFTNANVNWYITTNPINDNEFNLDEAEAFLNQRVSILLENGLNDSHFLDALFNHINTDPILTTYKQNNFFSYDNAGGCTNVRAVITGMFKQFVMLPKSANIYCRCFVLLDSDRSSDSEALEHHHSDLVNFLQQHNIPYHILEKRNMENYLPTPAFQKFKNGTNVDWVNAYQNLNNRQQDFFNIPHGFSKKDGNGTPLKTRDQLEADVKALYQNISDSNYDKLNKGLQIASYKANFPKEFTENHEVFRSSLLQRTSHQSDPDELIHILEKIKTLV